MVSSDVTTGGGLSPDKPPWFNCSSRGLGVKEECLHNIWLPLFLTSRYQGTDQHHLLSSKSYKDSLYTNQGSKDFLRLFHLLATHPKEGRWHALSILLLFSENSPKCYLHYPKACYLSFGPLSTTY